ncbi:MAG: hypothetical protein ACRYG8_40090 [Janthinobacterium lividum]
MTALLAHATQPNVSWWRASSGIRGQQTQADSNDLACAGMQPGRDPARDRIG